MALSEELKQKIDNMSYREMFRLWRFAPSGSELFVGDAGLYFEASMNEKKEYVTPAERVEISKALGWEP